MDQSDHSYIIERYNARLGKFGYSPETLGWDKKRHFLRYHILLKHWDLNGKTVMDFGCGFGDMYGYIQRHAIKTQYTGIDINPKLIATGQSIYPEANLLVKDLFSSEMEKFDYIFSSGVHNLKLENNERFIEATFDFFDKYSVCGFALNFMSDKVDYIADHIYHTKPEYILNLAYSYSNRITLRNDYMPFEFSIFIDKRNTFDKSLTVYDDYLDKL